MGSIRRGGRRGVWTAALGEAFLAGVRETGSAAAAARAIWGMTELLLAPRRAPPRITLL